MPSLPTAEKPPVLGRASAEDGLEADPRSLLERVRETAGALAVAQRDLLLLAAHWADAHPDLDAPVRPEPCPECEARYRSSWFDLEGGDFRGGCLGGCSEDVRDGESGFNDPFIPAVRWDAAAPFGAATGRSTTAASVLIRDALLLRHRLPRIWRRVLACEMTVAKARMIAQAILGRPRDVSSTLDAELVDLAHKVGPVVLARRIDELMLRLYPEAREIEQVEALDRRHVTVHESSINHLGIAEATLRADWKDLSDFDDTLSEVAAALARHDRDEAAAAGMTHVPESLDVRRARALGVLADPAQALDLLTGTTPALGKPSASGRPSVSGKSSPPPRKRVQVIVHLSEANLHGLDPVARYAKAARPSANSDGLARPVLAEAVRQWCGRSDTHLTVLPVLDLAGHDHTDSYRPRKATLVRAELIAETCVFPHCLKPAAACDHDHIVPFPRRTTAEEPGGRGNSRGVSGAVDQCSGATCDCNIAPLCRHHHQLKTHAGWRYVTLDRGQWLWSDPYGNHYLRERDGTRDGPRDGTVAPSARRDGTRDDTVATAPQNLRGGRE